MLLVDLDDAKGLPVELDDAEPLPMELDDSTPRNFWFWSTDYPMPSPE